MSISKSIFCFFSLLALCSSCAVQANTKQQFSEDMTKRLVKKLSGVSITQQVTDPLELHAKGGEWDDGQINLHRIWNFCQQASKEDCEVIKAKFVENLVVPNPKLKMESLRIIVRDQQYLDYILSLEANAKPDKPFHAIRKQIGNDLYAFLASDSPETTAIVSEAMLRDNLELSDEQAWGIAFKQTLKSLPDLPTAVSVSESAFAYQDFEYLGSLLIDLEKWSVIANTVGPDLFVTVVSDGFVMVGKMADGEEMEKFKKTVADDCALQERCISPNVYRFRNRRWIAIP